MKTRARIALVGAVTMISGLATWWLAADRFHPESSVSAPPATADATIPSVAGEVNGAQVEKRSTALIGEAPCSVTEEESEKEPSEDEKGENAEEEKVDAFDGLTDKWMDPSEKGVSMKDVATFVETFRKIPEDRQLECAQRALNLIPDENIMLLTGLLLDKRISKEVCELIFSDILNRDDAVKLPILRLIHKDESHPCWEDANWILTE